MQADCPGLDCQQNLRPPQRRMEPAVDNGIGKWNYKHAVINPHRIALIRDDQQRTYAELNERTNRLAHALAERGIERGDRVALLSTNSIEFLETMFAIAKLGAICVPINFRLMGPEVAFVLTDSTPKIFIFSSNLAPTAIAALGEPDIAIERLIVTESTDAPEVAGHDVELYESVLASGDPGPLERDVDKSDVAMILYTSGTTGRPKGAMITHGIVEANNVNIMAMAPGISKLDITATPAPLFHVGGLAVHTLPLLYIGGAVVILPSFEPKSLLDAMQKHRTTVLFLVPAMWAALKNTAGIKDYDLSAMRFGMTGGAPCPIPVIEFFNKLGWPFFEGFGMTETCAGASVLNAEDIVSHAGSVGQPALLTDARIVDESGNDMPVGTVGELVLRGPNITTGYWNRPEATAEAIRDGWFYTGDLGRFDAENFLTLVDRKKDMIITGGENVYPIEVEQAMHRHDDVIDVAVIGVPSERWGETVKAIVVARPDATIDPAALIAWTRERLAGFKCPTSVEVVGELPRNATGKILKRTLREQFTGSGAAMTR